MKLYVLWYFRYSLTCRYTENMKVIRGIMVSQQLIYAMNRMLKFERNRNVITHQFRCSGLLFRRITEVSVCKGQILLPVIIGDIVFSAANVIANC